MFSIILALSLAATVQPQMVVSTDWLANNLHQPNVVILDVTTREPFTQAHIPGAVLLDKNALVTRQNDLPNELPPVASLESLFRGAGVRETDRIIITSSDPLLATRAWFTLDYLGWGDRAAILDGGNGKWLAEHRRTAAGPTDQKKGTFIAKVNPATVVTLAELKTAMASKEPLLLIDARDRKYYLGDEKGEDVQHAGHIPGAECVPWTAHTTLTNAAQLRSLYAKLDPAGKRIVVYCRTGMQATMNYFVLRYLGFHPALYDGSYIEWNRTETVVNEL